MANESGPWSLGTLIWLPICAVLVIALIIGGVILWKKRPGKGDSDNGLFVGFSIGCYVVALAFVVGTLIGMYPYKAEYHQWRETSGIVTKIDKRLLSDGKGMNERFVVTFEGGEARSCDDTRCSLVEVGDFLSLSCKRKWQYTGTDGYDCNYYEHRKES